MDSVEVVKNVRHLFLTTSSAFAHRIVRAGPASIQDAPLPRKGLVAYVSIFAMSVDAFWSVKGCVCLGNSRRDLRRGSCKWL